METERKEVAITFAGETRTVEIERWSPHHGWLLVGSVVCRFRTGNKVHLYDRPQVVERGGRWHFCGVYSFRRSNVIPVAWYDGQDVSKW